MAIIYAILYVSLNTHNTSLCIADKQMQFTAFPIVFQGHRHWSSGISALAFIGVSVGAFMALAFIIFYVNPKYSKESKAKGYLPPEARLPSTIVGAIILP